MSKADIAREAGPSSTPAAVHRVPGVLNLLHAAIHRAFDDRRMELEGEHCDDEPVPDARPVKFEPTGNIGAVTDQANQSFMKCDMQPICG